ncbi:MAG: threonylcarbamoyl-AMP synthase [Bacteroidia bacterium]
MIGKDLNKAAEMLRTGNLVAIPTETVYGLAANALDPFAVSQIFAAKQRPEFNPLILHLAATDNPENYAETMTDSAIKLTKEFWPGPLSILLNKKKVVPDLVTGGLDSVVLRKPSHPLTQSLLEKLDFPLAAPSANKFQGISPTLPQHVQDSLGSKVSYILDGGASTIGLESTIVDCRTEPSTLLRYGGISLEEIEACVGEVQVQIKENSNPLAPGQMDKHYATSKPLFLVEDLEQAMLLYPKSSMSAISWNQKVDADFYYTLSSKQDLIEAAANLYGCMHDADSDASDLILVQKVPNKGLGLAINDRLKRASS